VTISNKDGSLREFVDYKNEDVEKKHQPLFAIFRGDDGRMFISAKEEFSYNPEMEWLNIFDAQEDNNAGKGKAKSKPAAPATKKPLKKPAHKKSAPPPTDPFDDDDDDDLPR
jgi:hypothetical protein